MTAIMHLTILTCFASVAPEAAILSRLIDSKYSFNNNYHIIFTKSLRFKSVSSTSDDLNQKCRVEIWNTPAKSRCDIYNVKDTFADYKSVKRDITCDNCVRSGHWISTSVNPSPASPPYVVNFRNAKQLRVDSQFTRFDWRFFGLSNTHQADYTKINPAAEFLETIRNKKTVIRSDANNDNTNMHLSYDNGTYFFESVFSKSCGYNPISMKTTYKDQSINLEHTTNIKWNLVGNDLFFPKEIVHKKSNAGIETFEENIQIILADFSSRIDDNVFTLEGMDLNDGQLIGYPELQRPDYPRWKNNKIDSTYTLKMHNADAVASGKIALPPESSQKSFGQLVPQSPAAAYDQGGAMKLPLIIGIVTGTLALITLAYALIKRRRQVTT